MFDYIQTPCSLKQVINLLNIIIITTEVFNYLEPTLPEHLSSPPGFNGVRFARSLVFCVLICRSLFVLFLLVIVLSVLRFTDSDQLPLWYPYTCSTSIVHTLAAHLLYIHLQYICCTYTCSTSGQYVIRYTVACDTRRLNSGCNNNFKIISYSFLVVVWFVLFWWFLFLIQLLLYMPILYRCMLSRSD